MTSCLPVLRFINFWRQKLRPPPDDYELEDLVSSSSESSRPPSPIVGYWLGDGHGPYITSEIEELSTSASKHGGMADIYEARWRPSGSRVSVRVAVKVMRFGRGAVVKKAFKRLSNEVEVWRTLEHRNVLPFYGLCAWAKTNIPALISPWCHNGDITAYISALDLRGCPILERMKLDLIAQVFTGVQYLHTHVPKIVHADIKGGNVLISDHGVARLGDFGLASVISDDPVIQLFTRARWMREFEAFAHTFVARRQELVGVLRLARRPAASAESDVLQVFKEPWTLVELELLDYVEQFGGISRFLTTENRFRAVEEKAAQLQQRDPTFCSELVVWQDADLIRTALDEFDVHSIVARHRPAYGYTLSIAVDALRLAESSELSQDIADLPLVHDINGGEDDAETDIIQTIRNAQEPRMFRVHGHCWILIIFW
ncbi:kinase-like protein [Exidia glandulosa HHB12029]|uniref:Kinase-like protein n=1 Tax=Exidia glandulosa HHB12029 TaxID=1314781 RepID=A0A165CLA7_EXIGL|nr:kinase-like protein [Exidia glandulosa HHB12029]